MSNSELMGQTFQGYTIKKRIGSGSYGAVYLGVKNDLNKTYLTVIKHISIPDRGGYESVMQDFGDDKAAVESYFEAMAAEIGSEINALLEISKKGSPHIMAYYGYDMQKAADPIQYDIFLRMEYLTPLNKHMQINGMTVQEVIRLGIDMCEALFLCHKSGIIHRNIKESNIFVSEDGQYKLGDFGIAKEAVDSVQGSPAKGMASYMAPEVYMREPYDAGTDIYSLGIVLYKLLNDQRLPFLPNAPENFTAGDRNAAEARRLKGEKPPLPVNAQNRLGEIVVKACSAKGERYTKADDLKADLRAFWDSLEPSEAGHIIISQAVANSGATPKDFDFYSDKYSEAGQAQWVPEFSDSAPYPRKKRKRGLGIILTVLICISAVSAGAFLGFRLIGSWGNPLNLFQSAVQENDFVKAIELYHDKIENGDSGKAAAAELAFTNHAEEIRDQYFLGEIEYETALAQLQEMEKLGISGGDEISGIISEVNGMRVSRVAYENAQKEMENSEYEAAVNDLRKVIRTDMNYTDAQALLTEALQRYKDSVMDSAAQLEENKEYEEAIAALNKGLINIPNDADFLSKISDCEKKIEDDFQLLIDSIIRDARNSAVVSSDYASALTALRDAAKQYPNNEAIHTAMLQMEGEYAEQVLSEAELLAEESQYEEAVKLLQETQALLPENEEISTMIQEYESRYPTLLQQIVYFTGDDLINAGEEMDNLQRTQKNVVKVNRTWIQGDEGFSNTYKLDGKYKRMTGNFYQPFEMRSHNSEKVLQIFGDGNLLFSATMSGGIEPVSFEIDLTGISELTINLDKPGYVTTMAQGYARLANVLFYQ